MSNASEEAETRSRSTSLLVNNVVNICIDDEEVDSEEVYGPEQDPYAALTDYPEMEMYYNPYVTGFETDYDMAKD
jgi:hypothetical protein